MNCWETLTVRESNSSVHISIITELASKGMDRSVLFRAIIIPEPPVIMAIAPSSLRIRNPVWV